MKSAFLLIDARGAEIQHRTGLTAPDQFIYLAQDDKNPAVFFDGREYEVMKAKLETLNNGVKIKHLEPHMKAIASGQDNSLIAVAISIMKERGIDIVRVSELLPYSFGQRLEASGFVVKVHDYSRERERKTELEIDHIIAAQHVNELAFEIVWQILNESKVIGKVITYNNQVLTSELLKTEIKKYLIDQDFTCPDGIIVASGEQTAQPHNEGSGPLQPHECIIVDIFPRSEKTGFFADMTRTFVKGEPSPEIKTIFEVVDKVQRRVADVITIGQTCSSLHQKTVQFFKELGHETSYEKGFMHGTGHSLGLNLHEDPRLNAQTTRVIEPGMVFTIEPGLYYPGLGGVRIEDVIVFYPDGRKENITKFNRPYFMS